MIAGCCLCLLKRHRHVAVGDFEKGRLGPHECAVAHRAGLSCLRYHTEWLRWIW